MCIRLALDSYYMVSSKTAVGHEPRNLSHHGNINPIWVAYKQLQVSVISSAKATEGLMWLASAPTQPHTVPKAKGKMSLV